MRKASTLSLSLATSASSSSSGSSQRRKSAMSTLSRVSLGAPKEGGASDISHELKMCYKTMKKVEDASEFAFFHSSPLEDADFESKPVVLVVGQYSTGKSTFIKYLLGEEYIGCRIGPEPTTDKFNVIMYGDESATMPGNALAVDKSLNFRASSKFGSVFLNKLQVCYVGSNILKNITVIDSPGILSGERQSVDRGYDMSEVIEYFASKADIILVMFDLNKLDVSEELRRTFAALKKHDEKIRVLLNKADVSPSNTQLMRVYGALMWSLGKVMNTPEVARVYIGSFWDRPVVNDEYRQLFQEEERDLFSELRRLPYDVWLRKINELTKRARLLRAHAHIISEIAKFKPKYLGMSKYKKEQIASLPNLYKRLELEYGVSEGDMPNLSKLSHDLHRIDWARLKAVTRDQMKSIDRLIEHELSKVLTFLPRPESMANLGDALPAAKTSRSVSVNSPLEALCGHDTPFDREAGNVENQLRWDSVGTCAWAVTTDPEYAVWEQEFERLGPVEGRLSGNAIKGHLLKSKLPNAQLSRIWTLSNLDNEESLTKQEFVLACYLTEQKLRGFELPRHLPESLRPPQEAEDLPGDTPSS